MKKFLILIAALCFVSCNKKGIEHNDSCIIPSPADIYDYPVKPGTAEWKELKTGEEMLAVSQVPMSVLQRISTDGLIVTVFNNPMFGQIYLSNSKQNSFDYLCDRMPCFKELVNRPDVAQKLLERYKLMDPACKQNNWPSLNGQGSSVNFSFSFVEFIIAQYKILQQIEDSGKTNEVSKLVLRKQNEKTALGYPVAHGLEDGYLILARIMYKAGYQPLLDEYNNTNDNVINVFINHGMNLDNRVVPAIHELATNFLK